MPTPNKRASAHSEPLSAKCHEIIVKRDGNRPLSFAGKALASVTMDSDLGASSITAALYRTRGGKFVSSLSKTNAPERRLILEVAAVGEFHKAQVFDGLEEAAAWFRPGRLTDALRKQLGLDEPERID